MSFCEIQYAQVLKEVREMAARYFVSSSNANRCTNSAVACTSARVINIMDTAIAAVSILVVLITLLRLWG